MTVFWFILTFLGFVIAGSFAVVLTAGYVLGIASFADWLANESRYANRDLGVFLGLGSLIFGLMAPVSLVLTIKSM